MYMVYINSFIFSLDPSIDSPSTLHPARFIANRPHRRIQQSSTETRHHLRYTSNTRENKYRIQGILKHY